MQCKYRIPTKEEMESDDPSDSYAYAYGNGVQCTNEAEYYMCDPTYFEVCGKHKCRCKKKISETNRTKDTLNTYIEKLARGLIK